MNKKFTKLIAALALLVFLAIPVGMWGQTKITDYSKIVSGNTYYIGATTGGTDYYLYVYHDFNSTSTAGTAQTSMNDATTFVFEGSGNSWTIKFDNGKYLSLKDGKDNGKVQVVADPATFTTSNQSGLIRLSKGSYSVQKNNSTTNFGSYANTQTDIWLMEVPSSLSLTTVTIDDSGITNTDVHTSTSAGTLSATVTENTNNTVISGAIVTWSSSNTGVATIANDGSITLFAEGTTTITAYYAGVSGEYGESSATYELNVSDSTPFTGGVVTFVAGTDTGSTTTTGEDQMTKKVVTISSTSAAFATAEYRLYSGSTTTISTSLGTITQIEFTKNGNYSLGNLSTETGAYTSSTGVWTGDATSIEFSAAAQVRLDQIAVTVTAPSTDPAITASDVNIAYDATSGSIEYTLQNGTGNVSATITSGDWLTLGTITSSTVPFTCSANTSNTARTATVTLSYTGASDKVVTVTQALNPNLANIAALTAQTAGNYTVSLTDALVTYTNGTNAYLEDASGAVLLYNCNDNNLNLAVGDKITGTANVTYTVYNNLPEVTAFTLTGYTLTQNNTVTPTEVTIATLESNFTSYISRYVKIVGATVTSAFNNRNSTIEQSGSSIVLRDQNNPGTLTTTVNDIVTVTAHPSIYNTTHQIAVYEQSQIVVAKVDPTISFSNGSVRVGQTLDLSELFTSNSNGAVTYSITAGGNYATLSGSELTGTAEGSVTVKAAQAETTSYYAGEATATITVNPALVLSSIAVTTAPTKTIYNAGETFDPTGMVVTATYTDNSTEAVTGYTYSPDGALNVTHTYVTISYTENSVTKTTTQAITVNEVVDYATLPFEWSDFSSTPTGITNYSVGSYTSSPFFLKFDGTGDYIILKFNEAPGSLTFDIYGNSFSGGTFKVQTSFDGQTYTDLTSYTSLSSNTLSESFNNLSADVRFIKWIYTEKSSGNVALGNITLAAYTAPTPTITLNSYEINAPAAATDGTLTVTYTEIETGVGVDIIWCDENGDVLTDQTEYESWLLAVFVTGDINTIEYTIEANDGAARTAYFKVYGVDGGANDVYSNLVTIAQAASGPAPATYTLINNVNNLVSGKRYIIASGTDGSVQAMGSQSTNNRAAVTVTAASNVITWDEGVYEVVIIGPDVEGCYTIYDVTNAQYLYAAGTGSSNHLKTQENINDRARWTISFSGDAAAITSITTATDRNVIRYNSSSDCFSCYASSQRPIYLFAKDNESTVSYKKSDIAGYGNSERGGYYLIASPVGQVTPTDGNGFLTNNYDLYAFDQSAANAKVWRNYEAVAFNLVSGRGYLYANSGTTTELTFEGMPYVGKGQVILSYDDNSDWAGWNLIGNPYATNATIPNNQSYYTLNTDRDELIAGESTTIGAMEGIFVKATAAGQSVTFTPTRGNKGEANLNSRVVLNLNGDHGVIDRAIVRFSEGGVLPKFMMNPENTRIYIRQGNEDFAVLNSEAQGEMPVNFKAATDGTYTISVEAENLDVNYLHLIDNKTGMDIDLLQTPSYTFEGKRTDYASRFRLVFSANDNENESDNENFAFISDGQIIVSGAQNATVQVVDMLGRVVVSRNSVNTLSTEGIVPGVYVIRVIDGENVRAQKIVVR